MQLNVNLNYRTTRALHICIVFSVSLLVELLLQLPKGAWTGFTVILIYAGFDVGSSIQRVKHRFWGVLLGLLVAYFIWHIGYLNYRLLLLIIFAILVSYYYWLGKTYAELTVFTTILSVIGTDYFASHMFQPMWYFRDYFVCTLLAALICIFFEYFIFFRSNMTRKFYIDFQQDLIEELDVFLNIFQQPKIKKKDFLNAVMMFNQRMTALKTFTQNTQHDYHNKDNLLVELTQFTNYVNIAYANIRKIFILHASSKHATLLKDTHFLVDQIKQLVNIERSEN